MNKETSLILTDYVNLGNYKIAEPLFYVFDYNTVAVVPFSIKSLLTGVNISEPILYNEGAFKIPNICKYTSIYLLTNKDINKSLKNEFNQEDLAPVWETNISYPELTKECELFRLTKNQTIPEIAHINIETAKEYCDAIPNKVGKANLTLELLKINTLLTQSLHIRNCESK